MPWRERFQDYMRKEQADLERRIHELTSRKCEMWETADGRRRDITEEYASHLRSRMAEIEQMMVEEDLS